MLFTVAASVVALVDFVAAVLVPQPAERRTGRAIPLYKRSTLANADKSLNFDALKSHVASVKAKVLRGLDNHLRNTGNPHPSSVREEGVAIRGAIEPLNYLKNMWYGEITVGTNSTLAQTFTVLFDTASTDLFIPAHGCATCNGQSLWNPTFSTTSENLNQTLSFQYDGGTVSVQLFTDNVQVAGLTATTQTFGAALSYPAHLESNTFAADGVMGMAYEPLSHYGDYGTPGVFDTLVREYKVTTDIFSLKLSDFGGSELYLDGMNNELYTGNVTYVNLTKVAFWEVTMDNIQSNGQIILSDIDSVIDTASAVIMGPHADVSKLYDAIGGTPVGDGYYTLQCDLFPDISFTFAGVSFPIPPWSFNLGPVSSGSSHCMGGIVAVDMGATFWSIGHVFLQTVYTTFDFAYSSVGFAQLL